MEFLLEPDVAFLNHGSFGACPRVVYEEYQRLQRQLELQPVRFIQRELPDLLATARHALADYIGAEHDEVVFVTNPTFAVNELARSIRLLPGDEILTSDQAYGACLNAWRFMQEKQTEQLNKSFSIVEHAISLPVESFESLADQFWAGVTENTKIIFLSHITSPTALTFPVAEICRRARERGILTIIDGAHAPSQLDIDMKQIGADFYVATCHKWLCAPKGSAFLYARRERQSLVEPLVVGWGWGQAARHFDSGSNFLDYHEWLGTHDPAAYLAVPKAIEFQQQHDWSSVVEDCHQLAVQALDRATELPGVERVHGNEFFRQMALIELADPGGEDAVVSAQTIKAKLYDEHLVEVPIIPWRDRVFVRVSVQAYNTESDIDKLVTGLRSLQS